MSVIAEIVDNLQIKIEKLFQKINNLEFKSQEYETELLKSTAIIQTQAQEIVDLKKKYETLKLANGLLGSNESKRDTKLKINSLIRDIDYCIAQLSE